MNYRMRVATIYLLGFFIDLVNMFIANVAYPDISHYFSASVSQLAWISNGYVLGLTLVIPLSSWLAKRIGTKRLFMLSLVIFIIAIIGVSSAASTEQLISWRVIQGLGGGLLIPAGQTMTYALYHSDERAKLSAAVMLVGLLAPALSPAIGGMLADSLSWRWVFLVSLPVAFITLLLAGRWLKPDRQNRRATRLDLSGLISSCSALTLILLGLTALGEDASGKAALLLVGGIALASFYTYGALRKPEPLLNIRLIKEPVLQTAMLIYQFIPGVFTGVNLITMLYLQNQLGMSAASAGAMMFPWAAAAFVAISLTGKKFNSTGPRRLFISGSLVQGAGIALLTQIDSASDNVIVGAAFVLMGFGSSLCSSTAQSSAFIAINSRDLADASALWNINRQLSFCFGVTLIGLLLNVFLNSGLAPGQAYRLCFILAAASVVIPIMFSFRLARRSGRYAINQEKR
ncbi:MFS transporter [Erwinia sp. BNK-24-b]|uniref:MFS transporter n=1 Tax=unclassified Erwinia TaxID=2622719 RepID=UPI0039BF16D6